MTKLIFYIFYLKIIFFQVIYIVFIYIKQKLWYNKDEEMINRWIDKMILEINVNFVFYQLVVLSLYQSVN